MHRYNAKPLSSIRGDIKSLIFSGGRMMAELREHEQKTLLALEKLKGRGHINQIVKISGLAHAAVMRAALTLAQKEIVTCHEQKRTIITLTREGMLYAQKGLPERRTLEIAYGKGGEILISDIPHEVDIQPGAIPIALAWLTQKHWVKIDREKGVINVTQTEKPSIGNDERLLEVLKIKKGTAIVEELDKSVQQAAITLKRRKLAKMKEKTLRELELTENGWQLIQKGLKIIKEVSQLTPELIRTRKWQKVCLL